MDIFESLENLNVSEECFGDILGIIVECINEDLPNYIIKKYGKPEYEQSKDGDIILKNKSAKLLDKTKNAQFSAEAKKGEDGFYTMADSYTVNKYAPKLIKGELEKMGKRKTKNEMGKIYHANADQKMV